MLWRFELKGGMDDPKDSPAPLWFHTCEKGTWFMSASYIYAWGQCYFAPAFAVSELRGGPGSCTAKIMGEVTSVVIST